MLVDPGAGGGGLWGGKGEWGFRVQWGQRLSLGRWKIWELGDGDSCNAMWIMCLLPLSCTVKYG